MNVQTIDSARHLRDGGIAAISALNLALSEALVGVSADSARDMKQAASPVQPARGASTCFRLPIVLQLFKHCRHGCCVQRLHID